MHSQNSYNLRIRRPPRSHRAQLASYRGGFTYTTFCPICLHQHHMRSPLAQHVSRPSNTCVIALLHYYRPVYIHDDFTNAQHDTRHNPTKHESMPRFNLAYRLTGPLSFHDIAGRKSTSPCVDDGGATYIPTAAGTPLLAPMSPKPPTRTMPGPVHTGSDITNHFRPPCSPHAPPPLWAPPSPTPLAPSILHTTPLPTRHHRRRHR